GQKLAYIVGVLGGPGSEDEHILTGTRLAVHPLDPPVACLLQPGVRIGHIGACPAGCARLSLLLSSGPLPATTLIRPTAGPSASGDIGSLGRITSQRLLVLLPRPANLAVLIGMKRRTPIAGHPSGHIHLVGLVPGGRLGTQAFPPRPGHLDPIDSLGRLTRFGGPISGSVLILSRTLLLTGP